MSNGSILVTGGTGTLGSALVRALCAADYRVIANYAHNEDLALRLREETGCELWRADISDEADVKPMFAELPPLFAVVHAAGMARDALLLRQSYESWHESLRVNATGSFLITRASLQNLQDGGRLILVTSRVGERGASGQAAYAASKAAMIGLMKSAAREGAERRISVNAICPPFVPSPMAENLSDSALLALRTQSLRGDFGDAQSFVGAVAWLLSDAGAGVSGQIIHCDDRMF